MNWHTRSKAFIVVDKNEARFTVAACTDCGAQTSIDAIVRIRKLPAISAPYTFSSKPPQNADVFVQIPQEGQKS